MDDNQKTDANDRSLTPSRSTTPQRPPIEWPVRNDTAGHNDRAAAYARQHVERVYQKEGEPNQIKQTPQVVEQTNVNHHTMREQPYDWDQYHTAWQQYYHQYFYRYYAGWWHQQKSELEKNQQAAISQAAASAESDKALTDQQRVAKELREKVRTTVDKQSQKVKASTHYKPVLAAATVGSLFLLLNYNQVIVGAVKQYVAPGNDITTPVIVEPSSQTVIGPEPKIIIPKIGIEAPVVFNEPRVDEPSFQAALEKGVVRLGTTANPGTKGNVVIGGHSSNNVFNSGKYKYVFVNLKRLDIGDVFYLNFEGKRFTYKVTVAKKIITPKETSVLAQTEKPTVTLFTCDPPGTNVNRLIVQAEQIDPSPSTAGNNDNKKSDVNSNNPLPSVAPSIWDRIFSR